MKQRLYPLQPPQNNKVDSLEIAVFEAEDESAERMIGSNASRPRGVRRYRPE